MNIGMGLGSRNSESNQNLDADLDDILNSANFNKDDGNHEDDDLSMQEQLDKMMNEVSVNNDGNSHRVLGQVQDLKGIIQSKSQHKRTESDNAYTDDGMMPSNAVLNMKLDSNLKNKLSSRQNSLISLNALGLESQPHS